MLAPYLLASDVLTLRTWFYVASDFPLLSTFSDLYEAPFLTTSFSFYAFPIYLYLPKLLSTFSFFPDL